LVDYARVDLDIACPLSTSHCQMLFFTTLCKTIVFKIIEVNMNCCETSISSGGSGAIEEISNFAAFVYKSSRCVAVTK
jgi:hypothetical protein